MLAFNVLLIRMYANNQSSVAFAFYGFVTGLVLSAIFAYHTYVPLIGSDFYILLACGIIAGTGGLCISFASKTLESSLFAPLQYSQLLAGFIFGYLFFLDLPDFYEILGSFIISLSGLFIIYREYKIGLRPYVSKESRVRDVINRGH
jgi:drug/metabolite transporter (DMT)-like permease